MDGCFHGYSTPMGGPSLYFHKVLVQAAQAPLADRLDNLCYIERVYACLTSWGVHRFDNPNARLVAFQDFRVELGQLREPLTELEGLRLEELTDHEFEHAAQLLGQQMDDIKIAAAAWPFVANSKLLHHLLPHLVPPMDRQYTLQYFIGRRDDHHNPPSYTFRHLFKSFWRAAVANREGLVARVVDDEWEPPQAWHTCVPKLLDNAIFVAVPPHGGAG